MVKSKLGIKRMCQSCGARFYDLNRKDAVCPKCGTPLEAEKPAKPRRPSPPPEKAVAVEVPKKADAAAVATGTDDDEKSAIVELADDDLIDDLEEETDDLEDADDDELIEDASDLGEDDDDMSEVREHVDNGTEDRA